MEFISKKQLLVDMYGLRLEIEHLRHNALELPRTMRYNIYLKIVDLEKKLQRAKVLYELRSEFALIRNPIYVYKIAIPKPYIIEVG